MKTLRMLVFVALLGAVVAPPAQAVAYSRVTVAATATIIFAAPNSSVRYRVLVRNPSAVSVYVGDASVTTSNGFEIAAGDSAGINLDFGDTLYGIVATSTQVVHTLSGVRTQ